MQTTQTPPGDPSAQHPKAAPDAVTPNDPGFKLPGEARNTPDAALPKTTPDTATQPVEIAPGGMTNSDINPGAAPLRDTSTRDLAIGGVVLVVLLVIFFFVRNAYVHHMVVRRVAPSAAGNAGWLLLVGLAFLSAAAVLAMINAARYLTLGITGPLVVVGVLALIAALLVGRR
jgi:hypothetical protein